jgi:hypothetical protein
VYTEAFRRGSWGVAQDLRLLTRPWGFEPGSIRVPTLICHGDADTTVPPQHARLFAGAIPGAQLQLHPGHGHFSIVGAAQEMLAPLAGEQPACQPPRRSASRALAAFWPWQHRGWGLLQAGASTDSARSWCRSIRIFIQAT